MKKRSLVAALAMLIVSAMVLTSATYAWFYQAAANVSVGVISAKVSSSDGSIQLQAATSNSGTAASTSWVSSLANTDFIYGATKHELHPVSIDFTSYNSTGGYYGAMTSPFKVDYSGSTFAAGNAPHYGEANTTSGGNYDIDYIKYSFNVRVSTSDATTGKNVTMTPSFARGADCVYAAIKIGNRIYLWSGGTDNYYPVKAISTAIVDSTTGGTAAIIDSNDTNYNADNMGAQVNGTASSAINIWETAQKSSQAGTLQYFTQEVEVYIWCEGNDTNCVPGTTNEGTTLSFTFA